MTEAGFLAPGRTSPTAIAIVVLMHGAALTALALARMDIIAIGKDPPTVVDFIDETKPPPPIPPEPARQQPSVIDTFRPVGPTGPAKTEWIDTRPTDSITMDPDPTPEAEPQRPPPPPPPKVEPARARANLASYVSNDDYPAAAIRNEEQGTTRFRLAVGADGRVTGCTITASSGSSALDSATCRLMRSRARFTPARDSDGKARSDAVTSAIVWMLPDE